MYSIAERLTERRRSFTHSLRISFFVLESSWRWSLIFLFLIFDLWSFRSSPVTKESLPLLINLSMTEKIHSDLDPMSRLFSTIRKERYCIQSIDQSIMNIRCKRELLTSNVSLRIRVCFHRLPYPHCLSITICVDINCSYSFVSSCRMNECYLSTNIPGRKLSFSDNFRPFLYFFFHTAEWFNSFPSLCFYPCDKPF